MDSKALEQAVGKCLDLGLQCLAPPNANDLGKVPDSVLTDLASDVKVSSYV